MIPLKCLVLTSFSDDGLRLKEALGQVLSAPGVRVIHPDHLSLGMPLVASLDALVAEADVVVADTTRANPNVLYELGVAVGLGLPVVLLAEEQAELPVALASQVVIRYDTDRGVVGQVRDQILAALKAVGGRRGPRRRPSPFQSVIGPHAAYPGEPFSHVSAEAIDDERALADLFVAPPYLAELARPETVVLEGPRGCGKTMLLKFLRFCLHAMLEDDRVVRDNPSAGFYVNFNTGFRYMGAEAAVLSDGRAAITYFNLLFLAAFVNDLSVLARRGRLRQIDESQILSALSVALRLETASLGSLDEASTRVSGWVDDARAGHVCGDLRESPISMTTFLDRLANLASSGTQLLRDTRITYLVDDYADDWLPEGISSAINSIMFGRHSHCSFRLAVIPGRKAFRIDRDHYADLVHDFILVSISPLDVFRTVDERQAFLQRMLDTRLQYAGSGLDSKTLLGRGRTDETAIDYSGLPGLARLSTGDYRTAIRMCGNMIGAAGAQDEPIPPDVQNTVIVQQSRQLNEMLSGGMEWSEYVTRFVRYLVDFAKKETSSSQGPGRPLLSYGRLAVTGMEDLSCEATQRLSWLLRSGALQASAGYRLGRRPTVSFIVNPLLFPAYGLPIPWLRHRLTLTASDFEMMLIHTRSFWEERARRRHSHRKKDAG